MMTLPRTLICIGAIVIVSTVCRARDGRAQSPRDALLVSTAWLQKHINDRDLVLLHVGREDEYQQEHIPGARFISMSDLAEPMEHDKDGRMPAGVLVLELPRPEAARAKLASLGISDQSRIIVYYGNDWVSPSTRIVHTLNWLGLSGRTSLLDGGMQAWKQHGGAVTADLPTVAPGKLRARAVNNVTVDYEWVRAHLNDPRYVIIDARNRVFYDGVQGRRDGSGRPGHIAGAHSFPFTETADDANYFRSAAELKALFAQAGYQPGKTIIAYCHIGQQATAVIFAARTLGYPVLLYDGSYTDWETHADAPVENPAASGTR